MRSVIAKHINPDLGNLHLHEIQPGNVQGWIADLKRSGLSGKTVRNCFVALRSIWRSLRSWGRVQHDAFADVVLPRIHQEPQRSFSADDVRRIIAASEEPHRTLYWLAAETGVRAGELCALRWESVDCDRQTITISRALSLRKVRAGKSTAARRVIAISETLSKHLAARKGEGWVFPSRRGTPLIADMVVKRHLKPLCARLGIQPGAMHAFRHFQASIMDQLNAPASVRKSRLGHSSIAVTDRYTHMDSADERRIADEIANRIVTSFVTKTVEAVM
jgi:integrase